jgi:FeS assembly SUF system regulator
MLRISKLTDYATVLLAELAKQQPWDARASASQLAEVTAIEPSTVAKVLKILARAGLIRSIRGVNGGYQLSNSPQKTSVASIVAAMEGPIALTECGLEPGLCSHEAYCSLRSSWQKIGDAVERALSDLTLADLAGLELKPGIVGAAKIPIATRMDG